MRWFLILLLLGSAFGQEVCKHCPVDLDAQFPEAPSTRKPHFITKTWLTATAIQSAATGFDIHETLSHEGTCALEGQNGFPEKVGAGELAGQAAIEVGLGWAVRVMAFHAPKSFGWLSYMTPGYATVLHLRGGIEWYTRCH